MIRPYAPLGAAARLLGVLALLAGLVAMHGALSPSRTGHEAMSATTTAAATVGNPSGAVGADAGACPMTHQGQSAAAMDCASAVATPGPGSAPLAAPVASYLLPVASLPPWPSPRTATFAPPAGAPSHVILRT